MGTAGIRIRPKILSQRCSRVHIRRRADLVCNLVEWQSFDIQGIAAIFKIRHAYGLRAGSALLAGCASNSLLVEVAGGAGLSGR